MKQLIGIITVVFFSQSVETKAGSLVVLCDQIKGNAAMMGDRPEAGTIYDDAITGGIIRISVSREQSDGDISVEFRDAMGQFIDAENDGARLETTFYDNDKMMFAVTANFPLAIEKYIIRLDGHKKAKMILLKEKKIHGYLTAGIYTGSCVVQ
jgi:hypothetical protein